jgi:hypothetical protein
MPKRTKTRLIEYFRLWPGNNGDSGTWDTDFISIPANTPAEKIVEAVQKAAAAIRWREEPPVIVGVYNASKEEEDESP